MLDWFVAWRQYACNTPGPLMLLNWLWLNMDSRHWPDWLESVRQLHICLENVKGYLWHYVFLPAPALACACHTLTATDVVQTHTHTQLNAFLWKPLQHWNLFSSSNRSRNVTSIGDIGEQEETTLSNSLSIMFLFDDRVDRERLDSTDGLK
jgi:hypothetical protein